MSEQIYDVYRVFESNKIEGLRVSSREQLMKMLSQHLTTLELGRTSLVEVGVVKSFDEPTLIFMCKDAKDVSGSKMLYWKRFVDGREEIGIVVNGREAREAYLGCALLPDSEIEEVEFYELDTGNILVGWNG